MPQKVLVLFAHPVYENSRINKALVEHLPKSEYVTLHDLYEHYPTFDIDIEREKKLLEAHDVIVWHHPFYWYSCPPILKQWIDLVLEFGWAYGKDGTALTGKVVIQAITTGGSREAYDQAGRNRFDVRQFLAPFEQTVRLCHMEYFPPFVVHGTHRLTEKELELYGTEYGKMIQRLVDELHLQQPPSQNLYLNEWTKQTEPHE